MENLADACELARRMVDLGAPWGGGLSRDLRHGPAPGDHDGNALRSEAIEILRNERPGSALEVVSVELAAHLLEMAGISGIWTGLVRVRTDPERRGLRKLGECSVEPRVVEDTSLRRRRRSSSWFSRPRRVS